MYIQNHYSDFPKNENHPKSSTNFINMDDFHWMKDKEVELIESFPTVGSALKSDEAIKSYGQFTESNFCKNRPIFGQIRPNFAKIDRIFENSV